MAGDNTVHAFGPHRLACPPLIASFAQARDRRPTVLDPLAETPRPDTVHRQPMLRRGQGDRVPRKASLLGRPSDPRCGRRSFSQKPVRTGECQEKGAGKPRTIEALNAWQMTKQQVTSCLELSKLHESVRLASYQIHD